MTGADPQILSINLTRAQIFLVVSAQIIGMIITSVTAAGWVGTFLVAKEFDERLDAFHTVAKPEIRANMAAMLELHLRSGVHPGAVPEVEVNRLVGELRSEIVGLTSSVEALERTSMRQTDLLEQLLLQTR